MNFLQNSAQLAYRLGIKRGWGIFFKLTRFLSSIFPSLRQYRALLISGDPFYIDLSETVSLDIFLHGQIIYEKYTDLLFKKFIKPGNTVIDAGANIGYYTHLASKLVGNNGHIYSYEPVPKALEILKHNAPSNVTILNKALSDKSGTFDFFIQEGIVTSSLKPDASGTKIEVEVSTLDEEFKNQKSEVHFIKIDVEGFELNVLKGAISIINKNRPFIYFELLDIYANEFGTDYDSFSTFFKKINYALFWVAWSSNELLLSPDKEKVGSYLFAIPEEQVHVAQPFLIKKTPN